MSRPTGVRIETGSIANDIRSRRIAEGINQDNMAKKIGVGVSVYGRIEIGKPANPKAVEKICKYFGLPMPSAVTPNSHWRYEIVREVCGVVEYLIHSRGATVRGWRAGARHECEAYLRGIIESRAKLDVGSF